MDRGRDSRHHERKQKLILVQLWLTSQLLLTAIEIVHTASRSL